MSREQDRSLLVSLAHYICPCFRYKQQEMNKQPKSNPTTETQEASSQNQTNFINLMSETVEVKPQKNVFQEQHEVKNTQDKIMQSPVNVKYKEEDSDNIDYDEIEEMQLEFQKYMVKHTLISRSRQPPKQTKLLQVQKYSQNKLLVIGSQAHRLLAKIKKVEIQPSTTSVNLQKSAKNHNKQEKTNDATIQKFWERRYILFEKFDQGIKLDTQSWYSVTPQAVAEHISSKISGFDCVLDAFAGAGGDSIQLSLTNKQVISNDIDPVKVHLLMNNAAVYGVDNIKTYSLDFFELQFARGQLGAVYMSPPWGGIDYYQAQAIKPEDMFPSIQDIIVKSLQISQNMALLLPANMDIQPLAKEISSCAQKLNIGMSCSILIQKIYFQDRLKFLLVLFGTRLTGINLGDQLDFIYSMLAQGKGHFNHKRVLKKLREDIGMIKLINLVLECQKRSQNPNKKQMKIYDAFIDIILQKKLISLQKLQKVNQMDELDENYRSKQTSKKEKIKSKQNQAITLSNPYRIDGELKQTKVIRISVINSSGIQQTVSYISEMSESKLPNTNQNHSLSRPDSESNSPLQTTINIQATQNI